MTRIKFATINTPSFREAGLNLTENWTEIDLDAATPEQRDMLEQTYGQIVQVHPDDRDAFIAAVGLEEKDGRFKGDHLGRRHSANVDAEKAADAAKADRAAAEAAAKKAEASERRAAELASGSRPNARVIGTPTAGKGEPPVKNPPTSYPPEVDRTDTEGPAPRNSQPATDVPTMHADPNKAAEQARRTSPKK